MINWFNLDDTLWYLDENGDIQHPDIKDTKYTVYDFYKFMQGQLEETDEEGFHITEEGKEKIRNGGYYEESINNGDNGTGRELPS